MTLQEKNKTTVFSPLLINILILKYFSQVMHILKFSYPISLVLLNNTIPHINYKLKRFSSFNCVQLKGNVPNDVI